MEVYTIKVDILLLMNTKLNKKQTPHINSYAWWWRLMTWACFAALDLDKLHSLRRT